MLELSMERLKLTKTTDPLTKYLLSRMVKASMN